MSVSDEYLTAAHRMKKGYDSLLAGMMRRYALTEYEVAGGIVLKAQSKRALRDESLRVSCAGVSPELSLADTY